VATDVIMPALGVAQDTGRVVRWLHAEGDAVRQNQPLIEVETDKVTVELEAPADGTLASVTAHAGDDVTVGTVIALILAPGEAPPRAAEPPAGRPAASPVARRMAREGSIDLAALASRLGRPVQADDVRAALEGGAVAAPAPIPHSRAPTVDGAASPVSPAWRTMAERTLASWTTTPHFALQREVPAGRLLSWQERARERTGAHITVTDLLVRAVAHALRAHPALNCSWSEGSLVAHGSIGVGLAVALDDGLVVPVIQDADTLDLRALAARRVDVVTRAREGRLEPSDVQGGTFTLSNLGMYGVDAFTAIINPPQAAILAVGRIADRVLPLGGMAVVQPALTLTLSCDHRAVDGARAGSFLRTLAETLEEPAALVS
jgi:pyruvate dehydrogenase E2 component (dihydrolipoyllysine-residue acetyltransferase)